MHVKELRLSSSCSHNTLSEEAAQDHCRTATYQPHDATALMVRMHKNARWGRAVQADQGVGGPGGGGGVSSPAKCNNVVVAEIILVILIARNQDLDRRIYEDGSKTKKHGLEVVYKLHPKQNDDRTQHCCGEYSPCQCLQS